MFGFSQQPEDLGPDFLDHGRDMYKCAPTSLRYSGNLRASSGSSQIQTVSVSRITSLKRTHGVQD